MSTIFGGNTGISYDQLKRQRRVAELLTAQGSRAPKNIGEGLTAIGNALAGRSITRRADAARAEMDKAWSEQVAGSGMDPTRAAIFSRMDPERRDLAWLSYMDQQEAERRAAARSGAAASRQAAEQAEAERQRLAIAQALMPRQVAREGVQMGPTVEAAAAGARSGADLGAMQTQAIQRTPQEVLAAALMGGADPMAAIKLADAYGGLMPEPEKPEYRTVGDTLLSIQGGEARPIFEGQGNEEVIFGADGQPIVVRGGAGTAVKFTEGQSKDNVYATRAEGAMKTLDEVGAGNLASRKDRVLDYVPLGLGRELQSEDYQVAKQSGEEFLQAILRKDTGAAITAQEQQLYGETYLPQPGDGPRVLEAKRASRNRALEAIRAGMNIAQITATERALVEAAKRTDGNPKKPQDDYTPPPAGKILTFNPETGLLE